jgi:hypothetical protein
MISTIFALNCPIALFDIILKTPFKLVLIIKPYTGIFRMFHTIFQRPCVYMSIFLVNSDISSWILSFDLNDKVFICYSIPDLIIMALNVQ